MDAAEMITAWWMPGSHALAMSVFIRLLGAVFFLAFLSLLVQLKGLYCRKGILPIRDFLSMLKRLGWKRLYYVPTVFWLGSGDGFIIVVCLAGMAASALLAAGIAPLLSLFIAWFCYLSFKSVGQDFLNFQWDALLIEVGFASMVTVASGFASVSILLMWFVFFRFMLMAGLAKVMSGDRTWRDLTAMTYHYQTQPLPNPLSWYAHNMPRWFHKASVVMMLAIENLVPFLIFGTNETRTFAFAMETLLQLAILLTGNYGALNLLTIVMGFPLLDDSLLSPLQSLALPVAPVIPSLLTAALSVSLILLGAIHILNVFFRRVPGTGLIRILEPFEISNHYGLFAVMTTRRFEIVLEWSSDGQRWQEYQFRWKPQDLSEAPRLSMPHMPRLDWLMWFLPFGSYESNPWFMRLLEKLLQNSPDVISLFRGGPADPPKMVRALVYEYTFTDPRTKRKTGDWWKRKPMGEYCPPFSMLDL